MIEAVFIICPRAAKSKEWLDPPTKDLGLRERMKARARRHDADLGLAEKEAVMEEERRAYERMSHELLEEERRQSFLKDGRIKRRSGPGYL